MSGQLLKPIYLISGDETLLINEARDRLHQQAIQHGFTNRERYIVERGFDWQQFAMNTQNFSLFSDKTFIELHNPKAQFDKAATQTILNYCDNPPPDKLLLIISSKLTAPQKKAKWYVALSKIGSATAVWPLNLVQLQQFIQQRLKQYRLSADTAAIKLLAELTQGNVLAADQVIQKLALLATNSSITPALIHQISADNSRFSIFDWSQFLLQGDCPGALHCLQVLQQTATEPTLILWLLARESRILYHYHQTQQFQNEWSQRQTWLKQAAKRLSKNKLSALIHKMHHIDLSIKGLATVNVWQQLQTVTVEFCTHG